MGEFGLFYSNKFIVAEDRKLKIHGSKLIYVGMSKFHFS